MNDPVTADAQTPSASPIDAAAPALPPSNPISRWRRLAAFIGPAISVAILAGALWQVYAHDWHQLFAFIPPSPWAWLVLALNYLSGPVGDWVIFRRLWKIPVEGIFPLIKKMIGNQILLSYVGEVYFYDWARRHVKMGGSPFGAVKDVAILSAMAGYVITLVMLVIAWPYLNQYAFGFNKRELYGSILVMLLIGLIVTFFRNRLLSLPRNDLIFVLGVHTVRLVVNTVLTRGVVEPDPAGRAAVVVADAVDRTVAGDPPARYPQPGNRVCRRARAVWRPGQPDLPDDRGHCAVHYGYPYCRLHRDAAARSGAKGT